MNFINNTNTGNELCNNVNKEHILIGKAYVDYSLLDNIEELYVYYTQLGGNGTIHQLVERIRTLPTTKED